MSKLHEIRQSILILYVLSVYIVYGTYILYEINVTCSLLKYPRNFFIIYFTYLSCKNLYIIYSILSK